MRIRDLALTATLGVATMASATEPEDRYRWLEDVAGEPSLDWVRARNEVSTSALAGDDFESLRKRLLAIYDSDERIAYVSQRGEFFYNFWRDAEHPKGLWRRTTPADYRNPEPTWDVLLDLDALAAAEDEGWVWKGATCLRPDYVRCLVSLSRGGADATVVREYDLTSRRFLDDGFFVPEAKSSVSWIDRDTIFVKTDFGEGSLTESGYARMVKRWKRGTPMDDAELVYEGEVTDVSAGGWHDDSPGFERDFVYRSMTFYSSKTFQLVGGELKPIFKQDDAETRVHREHLFIELRSDWTVGKTTYKAGSLLVTHFDGWMKGKRKLAVLFEPNEHTSLAGYATTKNHVILNTLEDVRNQLEVLTPGKKGWTRRALPGVPKLGTVRAWAAAGDDSDDYFVSISDYLTPSSFGYGTLGEGPPEMLAQLPAFFETGGLAVSQHFATSKDGTRIPYFQVGRADAPTDGSNPTLLYGYGGFEISLQPGYSAGVGSAWLERGGTYVVANIRGGGEYGPRWHQAALKEKRHKAYEDFIAVGEDLIQRGVTSTPHLGTMGGSNGGLLVGNMLTLRPDLWGAIVCKVPLLDMRRYHTLLAGASWMGEYGDPDDPAQWDYIKTFSPYHNVADDVDYPAILFTTSTRDDRVHPGHARKMAAKMLEWDQDVLYYENIEGGHGGAANNEQSAFMGALTWTFLWDKVGPDSSEPEPAAAPDE